MHHLTAPSIRYSVTWLLFLLSVFFYATPLKAQGNEATTGSGYCLDFTPNLLHSNHVDLGPLTAIDTGNFSIEMWVNVNACKNDPPFFSNKDWTSGNNPGIVLEIHDNGTKLRVNLKASNSSFQNIILPIKTIGRGWFHLAVTIDRKMFLKIYIDGILENSTPIDGSIIGSFASPYTYKLGQDGTGAYTDANGDVIQFDGKLDELRIWKAERTEEEIRTNMCKKISPLSKNLYAYYRFDTIAGNIVKDLTGKNPGKWIKNVPESWKISGAAIGDSSVQSYAVAGDWNGITLQLADTLLSKVTVKNIQGVKGVQLYKITGSPNFINGLNTLQGKASYYGVFIAGASSSCTYDLDVDYSAHVTTLDEPNLKLFARNRNSDHTWSEYMTQQDLLKHTLFRQNLKYSREYCIGTKSGMTCAAPTALQMSDQTDTSCTIGWTNTGASKWNTQWGPQGFELGTGTVITNATVNSQTIKGLKPGSFYEFYVQNTCTATTSYWVGPYLFFPQTCLLPTNYMATNITYRSALLTWKGNGNKSDVEWGLAGFTLGQGIPDSTFTDSLLLDGLSANTAYAYYVKTNCPAGSNTFNGPFTFKTLVKPSGIAANKLLQGLTIYPNPSPGTFTLLLYTTEKKITLHVYNARGQELLNASEITKNGLIKQSYQLNDPAKGIYFIHISDGTEIATKSIIIE